MVEYDLISGEGYLSKDCWKSQLINPIKRSGKNLCDFGCLAPFLFYAKLLDGGMLMIRYLESPIIVATGLIYSCDLLVHCSDSVFIS